MKNKYTFLSVLLFLAGPAAYAQKSTQLNLDKIAEKYAIASFPEFYELHSLPNDAHFPADIEKNVSW
ncbi:MAG: hypothetical protein ACK55U_06855 [Bacteroidota bacterium]